MDYEEMWEELRDCLEDKLESLNDLIRIGKGGTPPDRNAISRLKTKRSTIELIKRWMTDLAIVDKDCGEPRREPTITERVCMGAKLFCDICGKTRWLHPGRVGIYLASGWPQCCGQTMRLVTAKEQAKEEHSNGL